MESLISIHKILTFRAGNRDIFRCMKTFLFVYWGQTWRELVKARQEKFAQHSLIPSLGNS